MDSDYSCEMVSHTQPTELKSERATLRFDVFEIVSFDENNKQERTGLFFAELVDIVRDDPE